MRRKIFLVNILIVLIGFFILTSCATSNNIGIDNYRIIENKNIISRNYEFNENGNVTIKRDSGFMGVALDGTFSINNIEIFRIAAGEYYIINLEPGSYFFSLASAQGTNLGTPFVRTLRINMTEGDRITLRIFPMPTQGLVMEEVLE